MLVSKLHDLEIIKNNFSIRTHKLIQILIIMQRVKIKNNQILEIKKNIANNPILSN